MKDTSIIGLIVILLLHLLGEFNLYYTVQHYDKILHIIIPAIVCWIILRENKKVKLYLTWLATIGILGLTEVVEYLIDSLANLEHPMQGVSSITSGYMLMDPMTDTMIDLILGILSSLVVVMIIWIRRKS